jgi:hypothetical protein
MEECKGILLECSPLGGGGCRGAGGVHGGGQDLGFVGVEMDPKGGPEGLKCWMYQGRLSSTLKNYG